MIARLPRPLDARLGIPTLALAALLLAALLPISANAAPATGDAKIVAQPGQAKTDLLKRGVKMRGGKGKVGRAILRVTDLNFGKVARVELAGNILFVRGKRRVVARDLSVRVGAKQSLVVGKVGKRTLVLFRAVGQSENVANTVGLTRAQVSLPRGAANALAIRLGLKKVKPGKLGLMNLNAVQNDIPLIEEPKGEVPTPKPIDPNAAQCPLPSESEASGSAAPALPRTELTGAPSVSAGTIGWGFKESFRIYLATAAEGSATAITPASILPPPPTPPNPPQVGTFEFPLGGGQYEANSLDDPSDDQAVVDGTGTIVLCAFHKGAGFRITLANPTVTIDGEDSRLTADVSTNVTGALTPPQRVDVATIEPDDAAVIYDEGPRTVKWDSLVTKLTQSGLDAMELCNPGAPSCIYSAGETWDPISIELVEPWPLAESCDLSVIDPMPDPTVTGSWPAAPSSVPSLPTLESGEEIDTGEIRWGLRNALRGTVNSTGQFNLSGGATRSDPASMSGPGKYFTWPAVDGELEDDIEDRLVLRGTGTVGLCQVHPAQAYGTVLSDPTLVIDGDSSRLMMTVSTVFRNSWTRFGPVDLVSLEFDDVVITNTPGPGDNETITWKFPDPGVNNTLGDGDDDSDSINSAVKLTANGASAFWLLGNFGAQPSPYRTAGTGLNALSVSIVRPADE